MTLEEANKIIAEFMDTPYYTPKARDNMLRVFCDPFEDMTNYCSLDNLANVWEEVSFTVQMYHSPSFTTEFKTPFSRMGTDSGYTIQEAACIATAKAIKELK